MRIGSRPIGAVFGTVAMVMLTVPVAAADTGSEINGRFLAKSDGLWASSNERFHDEATVISTWTVTSTCENFHRCTGEVTSDLGWTAPARYLSGHWMVTRTIPNWEPCPDGTAVDGTQKISFYRDPDNPDNYRGWDETLGPSGGCGKNRSLSVELPFTLVAQP